MHGTNLEPSRGLTTFTRSSSCSSSRVRTSQTDASDTFDHARENFRLGRARRIDIGQQALVSPHGDWVAYADDKSNLLVRRLDALEKPAVHTGFALPSLDTSSFSRGLRDYVMFGAKPGRLIAQEHMHEARVFDLVQSETPLVGTSVGGLGFHMTMPDLPLLMSSPFAAMAGQVGLEAYGLAAAVNISMDNATRGKRFYDLLTDVPTQREMPSEMYELAAGGRVWLKPVFLAPRDSDASQSDGSDEDDDQPIMDSLFATPDVLYRWHDRAALQLGSDGLTPVGHAVRAFPMALHSLVGDKSWMLAREGDTMTLHDLGSPGVPTYKLSAPPVPSKLEAMREAAAAAAVAEAAGENPGSCDDDESEFDATVLRESAYAFSGDRQHMVGCFGEKVLHWDLRQPQNAPEVWGSYEGDVVALSLSHNAETLIAARMQDNWSGGEFLALRRGRDEGFATLLKATDRCGHSALSRDGTQFAAVDSDHLRLWDLAPAQPQVIELKQGPADICDYRLTFTPSGRQLVCSDDDASVVYDFSRG